MASGSTVKIDGIGTFYYTVATNKNGVATPEEVTSGQINGVRVRFIPEVKRSSGKQITTRSMVDADVVWMDIEKLLPMAALPVAAPLIRAVAVRKAARSKIRWDNCLSFS